MLRQELSANTFTADAAAPRARRPKRSAQAQLEVAQRGLAVTVTRNYYALVVAERKYATAQQAAQQAARFLEITQQQQRLGQVARSDVVKAEIQYRQQQQAFAKPRCDGQRAPGARGAAVPDAQRELHRRRRSERGARRCRRSRMSAPWPEHDNPDLRAADEALRAAEQDVRTARNAFFPTSVVDAVYGIEANEFALHSRIAAQPELGVLPNLGYFVTRQSHVPIWDWGGLRSKLHQSADARAPGAGRRSARRSGSW